MAMIFEFEEMKDAEAFLSEVKKRFGQGGQTFNSNAEAKEHTHFPWVLYPPLVLIDRVWADNDVEALVIKLRFELTDEEIARTQERYYSMEAPTDAIRCVVSHLAENKVEQLAREFDGEFVGT